jgi:hypothetical protein
VGIGASAGIGGLKKIGVMAQDHNIMPLLRISIPCKSMALTGGGAIGVQ